MSLSPSSHRIVPGITSVTMPGSRMMARRCFHIVVACPSQALFEQSPSGSAYSCPSGSMIMGTAGLRQDRDIDPQAPSIRGDCAMLVLTFALSFLSLTLAGQTSSTDRALFFAEGFEDTGLDEPGLVRRRPLRAVG